jgi:hypothetical protein
VTILLLVVWSACTARCAIENLSGAAGLACCNEEGGQSDQGPDGSGHCVCGAIQAGGYVFQDGALSIPVPLDGVVLFVVASPEAELPMRPGRVEPASSPPGALEPWQFEFRAALPARAPSLVS